MVGDWVRFWFASPPSSALARPKSRTLTDWAVLLIPVGLEPPAGAVKRTLAGLRSRWMMPFS